MWECLAHRTPAPSHPPYTTRGWNTGEHLEEPPRRPSNWEKPINSRHRNTTGKETLLSYLWISVSKNRFSPLSSFWPLLRSPPQYPCELSHREGNYAFFLTSQGQEAWEGTGGAISICEGSCEKCISLLSSWSQPASHGRKNGFFLYK